MTLAFTAATYGQKNPCQHQTKDKDRRAPKYRIGDSWRTTTGSSTQALQISIHPRHFNRKDMMALARQFNKDFCHELRIAVYIFDSSRSAQTFSIISHSPTYDRDFKAFRGFYLLDRNMGKEYIEFSSVRGRPRNETRIGFDSDSSGQHRLSSSSRLIGQLHLPTKF
jgi:hypothetical protein